MFESPLPLFFLILYQRWLRPKHTGFPSPLILGALALVLALLETEQNLWLTSFYHWARVSIFFLRLPVNCKGKVQKIRK